MKPGTLTVLALLAASTASASLIGTNVTVNYSYGVVSSTDVVTVGAGVELSCPGAADICNILTLPGQSVDISDFSITYFYVGGGGDFSNILPNGFDFQNLNPGGIITNVILTTNIAGLDASRLTFNTSSIQVDMHNLVLADCEPSYFTLQVIDPAVPEPSSAALALIGGALLVAGRVRSARARRK